MKKYLYGASVQGIQEFIFKTNKLQEIVGASEIVKNIKKLFEDNFQADEILINTAGNIKAIFDDKSKCQKAVLDFPKIIMQSAYGINISQAVVKYESGKLNKAFDTLETNLAIQRNKVSIPLDSSINILKLAPKTANPAVTNEKDMSTTQKEDANNSQGNIPKNKKNKTAIIHADGNGLGIKIATLFKDAKNDEELIAKYKNFSTNLEQATKNAFEYAKTKYNDKDIRDVILGGDDMTIICNANIALEFTNQFLSEFEKQTKKLLGNNGLSACAGIAYCNHKYPFHYAVNLAESLCSYSKEHSKKINKDLAPSSLMFHNIQSSNFSNYQEYINKELTLTNEEETIQLNYGPYFINEQNNYSTVDSFILLAKAFMQKGSPISRLREWLTILGQNSTQAKERLKRINEMIELRDDIFKKKALENCMNIFNEDIKLEDLTYTRDEIKFTPIADIDTHLSVVDYIQEDKQVECNK